MKENIPQSSVLARWPTNSCQSVAGTKQIVLQLQQPQYIWQVTCDPALKIFSSVIGKVTKIWAGRSGIRIPTGVRIFFSVLQKVQTGSVSYPTSYSIGTNLLSLGVERLGHNNNNNNNNNNNTLLFLPTFQSQPAQSFYVFKISPMPATCLLSHTSRFDLHNIWLKDLGKGTRLRAWKFRVSNPVKGKKFVSSSNRPDGQWGPLCLL